MCPSKNDQIFISYSEADEGFKIRLVDILGKNGFKNVWDYKAKIRGGEYVWGRISEAIKESEYFIAILSTSYVASKATRDELERAYYKKTAEGGITIIPVLCGRCDIPPLVEHISHIDFVKNGLREGYKELLASLGRHLEEKTLRQEIPGVLIRAYFDKILTSLEIKRELQINIYHDKEIDQKFLYWDVEAARRWGNLCASPAYELHHISKQILFRHMLDIYNRIAEDSGRKAFDFVNLGVGSGEKDKYILAILTEKAAPSVVRYYPIDLSFPMLQETTKYLGGLLEQNIEVNCVVGDILKLHRYNSILRESNNPKLVAFLGGSLGNFREDDILNEIHKFMDPNDYLILGVECTVGRGDDQLAEEYIGEELKDLVFGPLEQYVDTTEASKARDTFHCEVKQHGNVPNSKTIFMRCRFRGSPITLAFSTKYDKASLMQYLVDRRFSILQHFSGANDQCAKIVLKKA
ncbi:MAG: L-histidine N(alpha)-methyltransferase [Phycisphaerae bacterium]|nr:L-histidine N(alpha)-methyltransferase [Phycisphaerae bacterium]